MALVLIVDDNPNMLAVFAEVAQDFGHRVHTAVNGLAALAAVHRERPALILTDIMMPKMDGYTLINTVRLLPGAQHIRVVVVSVTEPQPDIAPSIDTFIRKPFNLAMIEAVFAAIAPNAPRS